MNCYIGKDGINLFGKWLISRLIHVDTIDIFPYNGGKIRTRYICIPGYITYRYKIFGFQVYKKIENIGRTYGDNPGQFTKDEFSESLNIELPEFRR